MNEKRYWMSPGGMVVQVDCPPMDVYTEVLPVVVGSREWACVMAMRGECVANGGWPANSNIGYRPDVMSIARSGHVDGWHLLPTGPKRGDRVKWWRGRDSGTGELSDDNDTSGAWVWIGRGKDANGNPLAGYPLWVERVEVLP